MKVQYFEDTDTLHIIFRPHDPVETRDLDEDILLDLDEDGRVCSMTLEHARQKIGDPEVQFEHIKAGPNAAPNGGPAASVDSPNTPGGPPSVS